MAADIIKMKGSDGKVQYPVTSSEAVGMSDGSGNLDTKLTKLEEQTIIFCKYKQSNAPSSEDGEDGDYCMLTSTNNRLYKKSKGTWSIQAISLANMYRFENNIYIKESVGDSGKFILVEKSALLEIESNYYSTPFYNLYYINGGNPFETRELARKYWGENVYTKYKTAYRNHGVIIYYELSDGTKVLEQFIGDAGSGNYFKDTEWVYILGGPVSESQSDMSELDVNSTKYVENKTYLWSKAENMISDSILGGAYAYTNDKQWVYVINEESKTSALIKDIPLQDYKKYMCLNVCAYSEKEGTTIAIQLYNKTDRSYLYNKIVKLGTAPKVFPALIVGMEAGKNYSIIIGKSNGVSKYYISNPVSYIIDDKPSFIHFSYDVDKEIDSLKKQSVSSIESFHRIFAYENKTINITTTFGTCPVLAGDYLKIYVKANYTANFRIYAVGASSVILLFESGEVDLSGGKTFEYKLDDDYQYKAITFRTGIIGEIETLFVDKKILRYVLPYSDWESKNYSSYGDSVTAYNNGDYSYPYIFNSQTGWGIYVSDYFRFSRHYGRGIGGQRFAWGGNGGAVSFIKSDGNLHSRNDSYNYDNYKGNVEVPEGTTPVRGCACSWLRITNMYPKSIKDTIDVITIMYHNDYSASYDPSSENVEFIDGSEVDKEWKSSEYYSKYNGDYNINTLKGGIASTIMKLQAWMPNAILVLCTPISGRMDSNAGADAIDTSLKSNMINVARAVKEVANIMSIPLIDVYATDGINGLNRTSYIADAIHPKAPLGNQMVARAIISGLKNIIPNHYTWNL